MERLKGSIVPLVTPYNEDLSIDFVTFRKLINWQIENGSHGISVAGSTGEMTLLSYEEKVKLFEVAVQEASGKVPVVASTGSSNLNETIALSKVAEKIGCDALLIAVPYYSRPNQEGIFEYFKKVSESVSLPIIIYNIPARTGTNIEPKTLKKLKEKCKNIIGVKEANPNFDQMSKDILECGEDFLVYSGVESLCYPLLAIGGAGYLSATANLLPKELAKLYELTKEGKWEEARKLHYKLLPINEVLFIDTNPIPLKTAMSILGMIKPIFRPPLVPLSEDKKAKLIEVLKLYFNI
jgi:4-hydroxy-tetrahydrodipicolinate synthase